MGAVTIFRLDKSRVCLQNMIFVQHKESENCANERPLEKRTWTQTRAHQASANWILFHSKGQIIASQSPYEGTPKQQLLKG